MGLAGLAAGGAALAEDPSTRLFNGWSVSPAGTLVALPGDMPLRVQFDPEGRYAWLVTGGFHHHGVDLIDVRARALRQHVAVGKAWAGLAVAGAGVYVSGGGLAPADFASVRAPAAGEALDERALAELSTPVLHLLKSPSGWELGPGLGLEHVAPPERFVGGLAATRAGALYAANLPTDSVFKLDAATGRTLGTRHVGYRPFQLALSPDEAVLAVGNWGGRSVTLMRGDDLTPIAEVAVGVHPTDLTFGPDGRLFVANAGSNSVSVIYGTHVTETILTSLQPGDGVGSTPDALVVAPDGTRLYVANADNNDIAVIDISTPGRSQVLGFIPTAWYPSALAISPDGRTLVVGIAKGAGSRANHPAQLMAEGNVAYTVNPDPALPFDYVGRTMAGFAEIIPVPGPRQLAAYTREVRRNTPRVGEGVTAVDRRAAEAAFRQIRHVVYVIRENRTYDQVLGDDPRGDGDPALAFFGADVTPNVHALVRETPLLDRFFVNGEVSEDGHQWANSAYASAFTERATATHYGNRGEPDGDDRVADSPAGHLWDAARRRGLSYYSYGEGADFKSRADAPPVFVGDRGLDGHACPEWGAFLDRSDLDRAQLFIRDLKAAEATGRWPAYTVVWLPWDHTMGLRPGKPTPKAAVATNDLALGQILEALGQSRFWDSTAVFVTEDDAQNGPDHVDAHRTVGLVLSPFVKEGFVDHTPYTMAGMIRTMELILGVPPMSQFDAKATPLYRLFQPTPRHWRPRARIPAIDLAAVNPAAGPLAEASESLDFSGPDRADPWKLNAILWESLSPESAVPAPVRSVYAGGVAP
jgi:YVTN family beta-propeller protein